MNCRHCATTVTRTFVDLGTAPPSNAYLTEDALGAAEKWFPLRVLVCEECWLVQTQDYTTPADLFDADYAYFSSFSETWLAHAQQYVADVVTRFGLDRDSLVVEVAANDGYLLQYVLAQGIPCLGIEPTAATADAARGRGIPIVQEFFGRALARRLVAERGPADLCVANNVLAHVPDINDFVAGFATLLADSGVVTFEFPHLLRLVLEGQVDTIYHEHFSYLSLTVVNRIAAANGLRVFDVEEHPLHGGSLRVFAERAGGARARGDRVDALLRRESVEGLTSAAFYDGFQKRAERIKDSLLEFLLEAKRDGRKVAAYGAAAKGNTLLNFAGVRRDLIRYVVDRNPAKQNKYMPGSRIPIVAEQCLLDDRPDIVVILPWNLKAEVMRQLGYVREWGGRLATFIPSLEVS